MLDVTLKTVGTVTLMQLTGDVDGSTAPAAQSQILEQLTSHGRMILDMTGVAYMSSAGLRMLLATYRTAQREHVRMVLVGLSEDLRDTMEATGFLDFFVTHATLDAGVQALAV